VNDLDLVFDTARIVFTACSPAVHTPSPSFLSTGYQGGFPPIVKRLTSRLNLVSSLRMRGTVPPLCIRLRCVVLKNRVSL
jgi:hypothetical protein